MWQRRRVPTGQISKLLNGERFKTTRRSKFFAHILRLQGGENIQHLRDPTGKERLKTMQRNFENQMFQSRSSSMNREGCMVIPPFAPHGSIPLLDSPEERC